MSRPNPLRKPSNLSIRPPSPQRQSSNGPPITPTNFSYPQLPGSSHHALYSPRRQPLPPSPTQSNVSYASYASSGKGSSGVGTDMPPPLPPRDKRMPASSQGVQASPYRGKAGGYASNAGAYDNKLVSSTLSHLPPLPPLPHSPTPSNTSHSMRPAPSINHIHASPRPSHSNASTSHLASNQASSGMVVFPDGTPLSDHAQYPTTTSLLSGTGAHGHDLGVLGMGGGGKAESLAMAHTDPNGPWSLLTVHVLPLFAGSAMKTPIEDLNSLCRSHIVTTSQRSPPARIVALLSSDLREFIASGMLTLRAKFETLEEGKMVSRAAEVWSFFWTQVLPYVEGVFLPFTQLQSVPTNNTSSTSAPTVRIASSLPAIPVRHLLLSGFLLHILLPLLPRLIPLVYPPPPPFPSPFNHPSVRSSPMPSPGSHLRAVNPPSTQELSRLLQMSLVLSTQAKYTSFFPPTSIPNAQDRDRDEEVRSNVEGLGQAVRWQNRRMEMEAEAAAAALAGGGSESTPNSAGTTKPSVYSNPSARNSLNLQRKPSLPGGGISGRHRRRGWRASSYMGQLGPGGIGEWGQNHMGGPKAGTMSRQGSGYAHGYGYPVEDDDDEDITPSQTVPGQGPHAASSRTVSGRERTATTDSASAYSYHITGSMMSAQTGMTSLAGQSTATGSTLTAPTITGGESLASYGETPTPLAGGVLRGNNGGRENMVYGRPAGLRTE
ncbi:hypothetical protein I350_01692 [Cryptococcus amylolentus CBS 6273]|uniref:HbrB-like protein n=1 Tax=Cryptococcus amylolentus CBS 6273 TaxID=1296118 RepID=A0A1E3KDB0_9TREE|nr:hypothetical protein I350_01692 [Cryptococcus amylolentus CBS 6273]